jgi:hypothetical protein
VSSQLDQKISVEVDRLARGRVKLKARTPSESASDKLVRVNVKVSMKVPLNGQTYSNLNVSDLTSLFDYALSTNSALFSYGS